MNEQKLRQLIREEIEELLNDDSANLPSEMPVFVVLEYDKRLVPKNPKGSKEKGYGVWECPVGHKGTRGVFEVVDDDDFPLLAHTTRESAQKAMERSMRIMDDSDGIFGHKVSRDNVGFQIFEGVATGIMKIQGDSVRCRKIVVPKLKDTAKDYIEKEEIRKEKRGQSE